MSRNIIHIPNLLKIATICIATLCNSASGVDLQPNDIVAPLPNKNYLSLSYQNSQNTTFYKNGSVITTRPYGNPVIDTNAAFARVSTTYEIASLPGVSYVQLPYGSITTAGSLSSYALMQAILGLAIFHLPPQFGPTLIESREPILVSQVTF